MILSQGSSWLHVGTDQPFKSISVGAASQVWAIARDGSAFYRGSVSPQSPAGQWIQDCNRKCVKQQPVLFSVVCHSAGKCWYHIPSPSRQKLKQVSVGRTSVHAVDENGKATTHFINLYCYSYFNDVISCPENLWYRQGVTPSYAQGSSWEHISNNVRKVSVGPLDQVRTMISIASFGLVCFFFFLHCASVEHFFHPGFLFFSF